MEAALTKKKKKNKIGPFDLTVYIILGMMALVTFYPFYNVLIISFARYEVISATNFYFLPLSFDLAAYKVSVHTREVLELLRRYGNCDCWWCFI